MPEEFKWGEDPDSDCEELKRREANGDYPDGHHDMFCPLEGHSPAPLVGPPSDIVVEPTPDPAEES